MVNRNKGIAHIGVFIPLLIAAAVVTFLLSTSNPGLAAEAAVIKNYALANCLKLPPDFSTPPVAATVAPASLWEGWSYEHKITLTATPATVLVDRPVSIQVSGLKPSEPITLDASMKSFQGTTWRSSATFIADSKGIVTVARTAPRYGSYSGVHAMGLIWSMLPEGVKQPENTWFYLPRGGAKLHLTARAGGRTLASTEVLRLPWSPTVKERNLDNNGLAGILFTPAGAGPHPAVIVLGGSEGGLHPQVEEAALLASHGYIALGLAYFQGYDSKNPLLAHLPKELVGIPLEYFKKAADWLQKQPGVTAGRIGIIGWSKGAEAALLLASTYPKTFRAVVAFAPSSEVWSGIHYGPGPLTSSWMLHGKPVPFASFQNQPTVYNPKTKTIFLLDGYLKPMQSGKGTAHAVIPVERIKGPVLLISGTDDKIWPSSLFAKRIMTRLKKHHHAYADESLCYQGAGHYILWPYRPTVTTGSESGPVTILMGGNQHIYAFADRDAWNKVLAFLNTTLH
ncbi:MAG: acyl-CoA thioester hydrolase/BAAT C-terminal domain-containing protein [Gammaproteobacteria bacterium]